LPQERRIPAFGLAAVGDGMMGWRDVYLAGAFIAAIAGTCDRAPAFAGGARTEGAQPCGAIELARGTVRKVLDGRTLVLEDGRQVRLAAIEVPSLAGPPDSERAMAAALDARPPDTMASPRGRATVAALNALAGGDEVVLRGETGLDRYGRLVAYAYVIRDGDEILLQRELLAEGLARVGDRVARACADDLLGREKAARGAKLGLWADPYYEVLDAEVPGNALAHRGHFALVEGKVASVRESGPTIFVNFGRRRPGDITVTILKRNERTFAAAGLDLQALAGRRVRVRGWVEQRGDDRAWMEAERPEQIEVGD
jgi:endonuclease YncB( thermonuclease family)